MLKLPAIVLTTFVLLSPSAFGQTIVDTIYTPPGYEDGPLYGTIYVPQSPNGIGIIIAHVVSVGRTVHSTDCQLLSAQGYTAMTIDYYNPLRNDLGFYPKPVRAVKTAVQFLRRNAARFNITTGKIVGMGFSAGAIFWGESIIWDNDYRYFRTDSTTSDSLDAAVLFYGLYDMENHLETTEPYTSEAALNSYFGGDSTLRATKGNCIANVGNITTPVLLFHGTNDATIHYHQSVELHDSLRARGKASQLVLSSSGHGFYMTTVTDTLLAYLRRTLTGIEQHAGTIVPAQYVLEQNFPNPFNPSTTIQYALPHSSHVAITVYNTLGQQVATLVNGETDAGYHSVPFDGSNLASGVYYYRLQTEGFVQTRKLLLIR